MQVVVERVRRHFAQIRRDSPDGQIHPAQAARCVGVLLPVNRDVARVAAVLLHEPLGLYEHPARPAGPVVDNPLIRLYQFA